MRIIPLICAYERRVIRRAAHDWLAFFGLPGLGLYLVAVAFGFTLVHLFLGQDSMREAIWIWALTAACPALFVLLWYLCRSSAMIDRDQQGRIASLEERLAPRLKFTWRPGDSKYLERIERTDGTVGYSIIGRVAIKNLSDSDSVRGLEVSLINYRSSDGLAPKTIDKNLINNATAEQRGALHAKREANFNMFKRDSDSSRLVLGPFVGEPMYDLAPGTYFLKVTASADNMRREDALFLLEFDAHGAVKFALLAPNDTRGALSFEPDALTPNRAETLNEEHG